MTAPGHPVVSPPSTRKLTGGSWWRMVTVGNPCGSPNSAGTPIRIRRTRFRPRSATPAEQARLTPNSIAFPGRIRRYITHVFICNGVDAVGVIEPDVCYAGLLDFNLQPKPAYWSIAQLCGYLRTIPSDRKRSNPKVSCSHL